MRLTTTGIVIHIRRSSRFQKGVYRVVTVRESCYPPKSLQLRLHPVPMIKLDMLGLQKTHSRTMRLRSPSQAVLALIFQVMAENQNILRRRSAPCFDLWSMNWNKPGKFTGTMKSHQTKRGILLNHSLNQAWDYLGALHGFALEPGTFGLWESQKPKQITNQSLGRRMISWSSDVFRGPIHELEA